MFSRRRLDFALAALCLLLAMWVLVKGPASRDSANPDRNNAPASRSDSPERDRSSVRYKSDRTIFTSRGRVEDDWTRRWREIEAHPRDTARDEDMVTVLAELAAKSEAHKSELQALRHLV